MEITPQCVPCLIRRCQFEARMVDPSLEMEVTRAAIEEIGRNLGSDLTSAEMGTRVHSAVNRVLGTDDPYRDLKDRANDTARRMVNRAKEIIASSSDPLKTAMLCSVVGNLMDFGIQGQENAPEILEKEFFELVDSGLDVDHSRKIASYVRPGANIAYLTDNCGEIFFDALVWDELRSRGARITVVARGKPVLSDATSGEIEDMGLANRCDLLLDTGTYSIGVNPSDLPDRTRKAISGSDLVIAKGMANFESMGTDTFRPVAFMLRTKCEPVGRALGEREGLNVIKLFV